MRWHLKSLASRLFAQFVEAQIKENIKAPRHWSLWGESIKFPSQRAGNTENVSIRWHHHVVSWPNLKHNTFITKLLIIYQNITFIYGSLLGKSAHQNTPKTFTQKIFTSNETKPCYMINSHDDVIKWTHFLCYWPFVRGIHQWIPRTKASDVELWSLLWSVPSHHLNQY